MAGILYVVATPIGNLEDVTLRALRVLREVSLIAAEDTRRTARLLQHYSISTRTTSLHEHNEHQKSPALIERLQRGESIALVSDAGTPLVSDPGQVLVTAARVAGIAIEAIPGASAVMTALSWAGLPAQEFTYLGFPPIRSKDRARWFAKVKTRERLTIFFEAPHRVRRTLTDLQEVLGADTSLAVGRELTKTHQELVFRPIPELLAYFELPKGEFTVLIPASEEAEPRLVLPSVDDLRIMLGELTNNGDVGRRRALKVLSERYQVGVNELYKLLGSGE